MAELTAARTKAMLKKSTVRYGRPKRARRDV